MTHSVAVLAADGVNSFELAIVSEIFGTTRHSVASSWYAYMVCGPDGEDVSLQGGMRLKLSHGLGQALDADTIIVPAWTVPSRSYDDRLLEVLRIAGTNGTRLVSLCTGAFLLAAAGLLDGRPATTHWQHAERLQRWYPAVDVKADQLYVDDGQILTSAGSSAAVDLSLHLVAKDYGSAVAADLARRLVLAPHREGGQTQFAVKPASMPAADEPIAVAMQWALLHLDEPILVRDLAQVATTSERTFIRHFDAATGISPMRWLRRQRLERAKELLETTELAIPVVANKSGMGSPANFRTHFARHVGVSPSHYRRSFSPGRQQA